MYFDNLDVTINESRILEKSDYYPFGLTFNSYNKAGMIDQKYKYNGKEKISDLGVDWYDYGARMYMADLGRWNAVDPLADKYNSYSPYSYVVNNPIIYVDPDGREIEIYSEQSGPYTYVPGEEYSGDDEFIDQTVAALNYLVGGSETAAGLIGGLAEAEDFFVSIVSTDEATKVSGETGDVEFNTTEGLAVDDGIQSPAVGLAHELGHKENVRENEGDVITREGTPDAKNRNKEEKEVMDKFEKPIVKELNQNGNNEGTRDAQKEGTRIEVECSTCNN